MDEDKVIEALYEVNKSVLDNRQLVQRLDELEKRQETRIVELEKRTDEYSIFISKTSGFLTRIGFYLDGLVIYLKMFFKK